MGSELGNNYFAFCGEFALEGAVGLSRVGTGNSLLTKSNYVI